MRSLIYIVAIAVVSVLAACAKKDNGGTVADTPQNCNVPGIACNTSVYSQNGWSVPAPIPWQQGGSYCGCPQGTLPVYNQAWGIGCAPNNVNVYNQYVSYNTAYNGGSYIQPQNSMPLNTPQQSYSGVNPGTNNCQQQLAYTCQVGNDAQCGAGNICRPVGGASAIGYCSNSNGVQNTTINTGYYNPYNNMPYGYPSGYVGGYAGYNGGYNTGYNTGYNSQCQLRTHQTNWGGWYQVWECDNSNANGVPR